MKKLSVYLSVIVFAFFSCEKNPVTKKFSSNNDQDYGTSSTLKTTVTDSVLYEFPNIPPEVVEKAIQSYNGEGLPAVTIALTYTRGTSNIVLEPGWTFYNYSSPEPDCLIGDNIDYQGDQGWLQTNEDGFVFLEEEDLCGYGTYSMDNRQGGWFDYVCGPGGFRFEFLGDPVFVLVRLWCE